MDQIEKGATKFVVGKKVGRRAKVKNATKITAHGLEFDSKLEFNCYTILLNSGLKFVFKPDKLILTPGFTTDILAHNVKNEKTLRSMLREASPDKKFMETITKSEAKMYSAECKRDQSRIKRLFNIAHKKVIRQKKILPTTWAPDFYLPDHDLYIESKGFANDSFPIKFKMARWKLGNGMDFFETYVTTDINDQRQAIEVSSKKELEDVIAFLEIKKTYSTRDLLEYIQNGRNKKQREVNEEDKSSSTKNPVPNYKVN